MSRFALSLLFLLTLATVAAAKAGPTPPELAARLDAPVLMGHFTTNYPGSQPDRNFNMALAMRHLSGTVVPAGATFSFNGTIGDANRANGYRKGRVFVGDRIVEDYGGGVCQVVATLYNAVVRAGLPVVERHLHGLTVPYLPPGEDATIAYGALDFRFRNDTGAPLFLWGETEGGRVTVAVYGVRPGPEVEFRHRLLGRTKAGLIRIPTARLRRGLEEVLAPGQDGVTVATVLLRRWGLGPVQAEDLGVHTYRASPRILAVGTA
jgi:vancomycin resistance protein VanW